MSASESTEHPAMVLEPWQLQPEPLRAALSELEPSGDQEPKRWPLIQAVDAAGHHDALMGLDHAVRVEVAGPLGDHACAYNRQAEVRIRGPVGSAVAEGMRSGAVRVYGGAGHGAGVAIRGGTLAVYGHAGDRCGAGLAGGEIFVRGNVGTAAGVGALGGTIVIGGNAGPGLGAAMSGATIFVRGTVASLAPDVVEAPLRERERLRLGLLLINAAIRGDAKDFRRIIPRAMFQQETNRPRGEIDPSWR